MPPPAMRTRSGFLQGRGSTVNQSLRLGSSSKASSSGMKQDLGCTYPKRRVHVPCVRGWRGGSVNGVKSGSGHSLKHMRGLNPQSLALGAWGKRGLPWGHWAPSQQHLRVPRHRGTAHRRSRRQDRQCSHFEWAALYSLASTALRGLPKGCCAEIFIRGLDTEDLTRRLRV
jgi:hypothetical protein